MSPRQVEILAAVWSGPVGGSYGGALADMVGISRAAVYVLLGILEESGHLRSSVRPGPLGPPLRFYRVTLEGMQAVTGSEEPEEV